MTKRIVLCADDYGQAEAVSRGILDLVAAKRLTAVSCLVNTANIVEAAKSLLVYADLADIGLHLNFTDGAPLSRLYRETISKTFQSLPLLLWRTHIGWPRLPYAAVLAEIHAQLDAFTNAFGKLPRFVDGHQHIHHLPVIREALFTAYAERLAAGGVYLRAVTLAAKPDSIKSRIIQSTGGHSFALYLDQRGIPHNTTFSGIYSFTQAHQYRTYFQRFIAESGDHGLIMCHPGLSDGSEANDPIRQARWLEYQYLKSPDMLADCERAQVSLARF